MLEDINRACTLFVGDLSSCCTEENLQTAFGQYGKVKHVRIQQIKDKHSGQKVSAGYGFVRMFSPEQAEIAMASIDGTLIAGRQVRVRYATYHTEDASKVESRMSLYVKYVAKTQTAYTNEEIIRELFSKFGVVVDVTIRKQFLNSVSCVYKSFFKLYISTGLHISQLCSARVLCGVTLLCIILTILMDFNRL